MVCALVLVRVIFSLKETILLLILALKNPCFLISSKVFLCSPFLPETSGDKMYAVWPESSLRRLSTILAGGCLDIVLPHSQQWGFPMLAKSSLK
jgi:hypothetical protein